MITHILFLSLSLSLSFNHTHIISLSLTHSQSIFYEYYLSLPNTYLPTHTHMELPTYLHAHNFHTYLGVLLYITTFLPLVQLPYSKGTHNIPSLSLSLSLSLSRRFSLSLSHTSPLTHTLCPSLTAVFQSRMH